MSPVCNCGKNPHEKWCCIFDTDEGRRIAAPMKPSARIIEPECELELYDAEHILVRMKRVGRQPVEIVLEDAAFKELSRRRVTLRFNEAALSLSPAAADEPHGRPRK